MAQHLNKRGTYEIVVIETGEVIDNCRLMTTASVIRNGNKKLKIVKVKWEKIS